MGSGGRAVSKSVWLNDVPGATIAEPSARMELSLPMTGLDIRVCAILLMRREYKFRRS